MKDYLVGFGRVDITPNYQVSLGGYGNYINRHNDVTLDPLYATCVAITDENDTTIVYCAVDNIRVLQQVMDGYREGVHAATGIPKDRIFANASHTHSGPETKPLTGIAGRDQYIAQQTEGMIQAAKLALADRSEAKMFGSSIDVAGMNFVKHYTLDNGKVAGDNHGSFKDAKITGHCAPADPQMQLLKFVREGKKDILIANWQAHATVTGGINFTNLSADFPGSTRMSFEEKVPGCYFLYMQGSCGDLNPKSYIPEEDCTRDYILYGQQLSDYAIRGMENMTEYPAGPIKTKQEIFTGKVNHTLDHLVPQGGKIWVYFAETGDRSTANKMAREIGLESVYHAGTICSRAKQPEEHSVELDVIQLGDVAIACNPHEFFNRLGKFVKDSSPYKHTLMSAYSNGFESYLPTKAGYEYGCYEADVGIFAPGEGENMADALVRMLHELKG